jgi:hypothetical protein
MAKQNSGENPISTEKAAAEEKCLERSLRRNPKLSVRTPQGLSFSQKAGLYRLQRNILGQQEFPADETGLSKNLASLKTDQNRLRTSKEFD